MARTMPIFAEAFGYTPSEFRSLTLADFTTLTEFLSTRGPKLR